MAAISKAWVDIADSAVDPGSPLDTVLVTGMRDDLIHLREWMGKDFYAGAVQNHSHDGMDSFLVRVGPNYLRNGSFEDGATGWTLTNYTGGSNAISTSTRHHGDQSLSFTSTVLANGGGDAVSNEFVPCGGLSEILLTVWRSASVAGVSSKAEVIWYDAAQAQISASTIFSDTSTLTTGKVERERLVAPSSARFYRVKLTGGVPAVGSATGTIFFDGLHAIEWPIAYTGERPKCVLPLSLVNIVASATRYASCYGGTILSAEPTTWSFGRACTVKGLYVNLNASPAANIVITLMKNGADTTQTVTLNGTLQQVDLAHPITFGKGDRFAVKCAAGALGVSTIDGVVALEITEVTREVGSPQLFLTNDVTGSAPLTGFAAFTGLTPLTVAQSDIPLSPCVVMVIARSNGGSATWHRNGVADSPIGYYDDTAPFDFPIADGETFTGILASTVGRDSSLELAPPLGTNQYPPAPLVFGFTAGVQSATRYAGGIGRKDNAANNATIFSVESEAQILMPACRVKGLRAVIDSVPAAGQTHTLTLRKNGVATGITVQFTNAGAVYLSETATEVTFNGTTDLLSLEDVATATAGNKYIVATLGVYYNEFG